jgi:hypothetical protein
MLVIVAAVSEYWITRFRFSRVTSDGWRARP